MALTPPEKIWELEGVYLIKESFFLPLSVRLSAILSGLIFVMNIYWKFLFHFHEQDPNDTIYNV